MASDLGWQTFLFRVAIRRQYTNLESELLNGCSSDDQWRLKDSVPDIEAALYNAQKIIDEDSNFDQFPQALEIMGLIKDQIGEITEEMDILFDHVFLYTRMLHLLSTIGKQASQQVKDLMSDYFSDVNRTDLGQNVISSIYDCVHRFVFQTLISEKRSLRFSAKKFPIEFEHVRERLRRVFKKLVQCLECALPKFELENIDDSDPVATLYDQQFGKLEGGYPKEQDLIGFVESIRDGQPSIVVLDGLNVSTPSIEDMEAIGASSQISPTNDDANDSDGIPTRSKKRINASMTKKGSAAAETRASRTSRRNSSINIGAEDDASGANDSDDSIRTRGRKSINTSAAKKSDASTIGGNKFYQDLGISKVFDEQGNSIFLPREALNRCVVLVPHLDAQDLRAMSRGSGGETSRSDDEPPLKKQRTI